MTHEPKTLTDRLLSEADGLTEAGYASTAALLAEAADEIERLKSDVSDLSQAIADELNP